MQESERAETPTLTIYGKKESCTSRCLWMVEEMGLEYRHIPIDHKTGECKTAEYLAINPGGKIPSLVEGDFVLTESMSINFYLAGKNPGLLLSNEPLQRAAALQWTLWAVTEIESHVINIVRELRRGEGRVEQDRVTGSLQALAANTHVIETHLTKGSTYLLGEHFSIADINAASVLSYFGLVGFTLEDFPMTEAWLSRCLTRPAWQKLQD
jgi:glutathione S-transferase